MRCPKCHYLSFDPEPRCRNCGYELSLAEQDDLSLGGREETGSLDDLVLNAEPPADEPDLAGFEIESEAEPDPPPAERTVRGPFDEPAGEPDDQAPDTRAIELTAIDPGPERGRGPASSDDDAEDDDVEDDDVEEQGAEGDEDEGDDEEDDDEEDDDEEAAAPARPAPATSELPLFVRGGQSSTPEPDDEVPLDIPTGAHPPLAVRRRVSEPPASRTPSSATRKLGPLDRDLLEDLQRFEAQEKEERARQRAAGDAPLSPAVPREAEVSVASARLGAAAVDALFVGTLSAGVLAVTLRWCELPMAEVWMLPVVPTAAFLLLVCAGYLLMFTAAGGQTLGKMALGLKVVAEGRGGNEQPLTLRQAVYRELLTIPSVLMLGAGFVPGLFGDQRAMHDRLAHTRVVRA